MTVKVHGETLRPGDTKHQQNKDVSNHFTPSHGTAPAEKSETQCVEPSRLMCMAEVQSQLICFFEQPLAYFDAAAAMPCGADQRWQHFAPVTLLL
jgi:hypothetical protein